MGHDPGIRTQFPRQLIGGNGYSAENCPTLDFVEMFDGFPKNPDGTIKVFDANGKYLMYNKVTDLFANAEPRLRAYVILPGEAFKGEAIEICGNKAGVDEARDLILEIVQNNA